MPLTLVKVAADGAAARLVKLSSSVVAGTDPARWMVASRQIVPPLRLVTADSTHVAALVENPTRTPSYPCSEFVITDVGWCAWNSPVGGTINGFTITAVEQDTPNDRTLVGRSISFDNGATWQTVNVGTGVIPAGGILTTTYTHPTAVPKDTDYLVRSVYSVANGEVHAIGYRFDQPSPVTTEPRPKCAWASDSTGSATFLAGSSSPATNASGNFAYSPGPAAILARGGANASGYDGRKVGVCVGDSIGFGTGDGSNGLAWLTEGIEDAVGASYLNLCVPSTKASQQTGSTSGVYKRRAELAASLVAHNASSAACWTFVLSEMGRNDGGNTSSSQITGYRAWIAYLKTIFPGAKVGQTTITPRVNSTGSMSTYADQTPDGTDTAVKALNAQILADVGSYLDFAADAAGQDRGPATPTDYSDRHKLPSPQFTTTLAAAVAANASSMSMTDSPPLGSHLAVGVGDSNLERIGRVTTVTGTGPYAVQFNFGQNKAALSHNSGDAVAQISTAEGLHPNQPAMKTPVTTAVLALT